MRVAHLSDVHVLERRPGVGDGYTLRTRLVSYARTLDPQSRLAKLRRSLAAVRESGASHVVITGDLTEIGSEAQFDVFAQALHDSKITPDSVTLVPGNHDAYTSSGGWTRAMSGSLAAFAGGSAGEMGKVVDRGEVVFLPIDASRFQSITRAGGEITSAAADAIEARLRDPWMQRRSVVLVQHHPPFAAHGRVSGWIDGLRGGARLVAIAQRHPNVQILHGHLHKAVDCHVGACRIFGAPAVVDDREGARVRVYDLKAGVFEAAA
jgi:3',5'-cyclic-AMP phosphodiesterase